MTKKVISITQTQSKGMSSFGPKNCYKKIE